MLWCYNTTKGKKKKNNNYQPSVTIAVLPATAGLINIRFYHDQHT